MSIWSRLWGSEKALEMGAEALIKTGDALVYTSEEKAQDADKRTALRLQFLESWVKSTSGQNIARRIIALSFSAVYLLLVLVTAALSIAAALASPENAKALAAAAGAAFDALATMSTPQSLIMIFYYAPNKIGEAIAAAKMKLSPPAT